MSGSSSVFAPTLKRDTAVGAFDDADAAVVDAAGAGVVGAGVVGADCAGVAGFGVWPPAEEADGVMLPLACFDQVHRCTV